MAEKEVKIKVSPEVEDNEVKALEQKLKELKSERIQAKLEADTKALDETKTKIESVKAELAKMDGDVDVDDSEVEKLQDELASLESKALNLEIAVETGKLAAAKEMEESLNDTAKVDIEVDETAVQTAMGNISDGISKAKQGMSELKDAIQEVEQAGMQSEQNKAFLEMNLGAEEANKQMQQISDTVAKMPGDDNTMRSVLSTAQALGNDLKPEEMEAATKTMADYMSGSATMGKMATESQQDIMKYLLDGNTAELERGSIVSSQVDKLKDANTFMERQAAMQQVLNDLGYGGISTQDTMLNKQAEWEGMLYNSSDALSSMWLGAEKGAMDYVLQLNDATDGLAGMAIVAGSVAGGPIIDAVSGLAQMATGMKAIKDLGFISFLKELEITTKLSAAADWLLSGAQAVLNAIMSMNPIVLVVLALVALAAALIWAYYNVDWFRAMVDNAWNSIVQFGQQIWAFVSGAIAAFVAWTDGASAQVSGFVSWLVGAIVSAGASLVARVQAVFSAVWSVISAAMNMWNQATAKAREIANAIGAAFSGVKAKIQGAFNGVTSAITAPFTNAYNTLKPIIDNIKKAYDMLTSLGGSAGIVTGSAGINMGGVNSVGSANNNLISTVNNPIGGSPSFVFNGIIEESAGDFIVRKLSDEIYKQNVLRGVE